MLSEKIKQNLKNIISKYEKKESAIISILHEIQKEKNYIEDSDISELAKLTELPYSKIKAVLTFYTMFNSKKVGKYHIQICRNISCHMAGAKKIEKYISEKLGIREGEVTKDLLFSYSTVECLGSCGTAPVIMINETYYENVDEKKIDEIIEKLKVAK
ncbi:MAG TPA: NADH-quinone oxidoreductase subunit NuoE [Elusimicrobiales bacterium]|nr:NADH-quinone oxidoreductase subunit NuoE [Elusimicrobiales bacterium]HOL63574.1 NADH-quinone oxidoreductase subunit NuoE [Elusimicrobiales bacterium]HPO95057.1 NADH-quinone oxidoreductase subunit NuoE [Elusimicrobiales bacterium]